MPSYCDGLNNQACDTTCKAAISYATTVLQLGSSFEPLYATVRSNPHLQWLVQTTAHNTALPVDQSRYLLSHVFVILLAIVWRLLPHSNNNINNNTSTVLDTLRQCLGAMLGIFLLVFCFDSESFLLAPMVVLSYWIATLITRFRLNPLWSIVFCVCYLCSFSARQMCQSYRGWVMSIEGPFMMLTIRCSTLIFNVRDGQMKKQLDHAKEHQEEELSTQAAAAGTPPGTPPPPPPNGRTERIFAERNMRAVHGMPSFLEYLCHAVCFIGVLSVPCHTLKEYRRFIRAPTHERTLAMGIVEAVCTFLYSLVLLIVVSGLLGDRVPLTFTETPAFLNSSFGYKTMYIFIGIWLRRYKYYGGFGMPEAGSHLAGMRHLKLCVVSQRHQSLEWEETFVPFSNNVLLLKDASLGYIGTEVAQTPAALTYNWNKAAGTWIRTCVFERVLLEHGKRWALCAAYCCSAIWHGLYPTYFLSFVSFGLVQAGVESVKKDFRALLGETGGGCMLWFVTGVLTHYCFLPFVSMDLVWSIQIWSSQYWYGHVLAVAMLLRSFLRKKKSSGGGEGGEKMNQKRD